MGTLLYLTKHSRPDITTNPVRELSKSMDGASMAQVTEMGDKICSRNEDIRVKDGVNFQG